MSFNKFFIFIGGRSDSLEEIRNIVEAFFDRLHEHFSISVLEEPDAVTKTPSPNSQFYCFENKYSPKLKLSRVLRSGLKLKNRVISPCIVVQIEN